MIERWNWFRFIRSFFGIGATDDWLNHVVRNWNFSKNEPGCICSWSFLRDPMYEFCDDFLEMQRSKLDEG